MIIQLTQGKVAQVDEIDSDLFNMRWCISQKGRTPVNQRTYAVRCINGHMIYMHRIILERILDRSLRRGEYVDHINHDGLDNHRTNLRLSTNKQNHANMRKHGDRTSSRFKGVYWSDSEQRWVASIFRNGRRVIIRRFISELDAALAYDEWARELDGEFACTNFP